MPRFDVHQHLWPEQLVSALSKRRDPPCLRGTELELREGTFETDLAAHDLQTRLQLLDRDEIDVAVVSLPPTLGSDEAPELAAAYDEGILEVAATSGGRIRPLAAGDERDGFAGTCISAPRVVAEGLAGRTKPVFVHPGYAHARPGGLPAWWTPVVDYTAQMQAAFAAVLAGGAPDVPVIFAILAGGGPVQLERLRQRGDASGLPENLYFDTASYGRHALDLVVGACGVDRLVYGSDTPVMDSKATRQAIGDWFDRFAEENPGRIFE
jgi:predicted TIM-barrel fold metal-dependent hydrolase